MTKSVDDQMAPIEPQQLVFDLPHRAALNAEDFFVSDCNKNAVELIDNWPDWPHHAVLIAGPAACGKSHLVNVWRMNSGAELVKASDLNRQKTKAFGQNGGGTIVEDVDRKIADEQALFHLLNLAKEQNFHVLLTARSLPGEWKIKLPDLRSRARSFAVVSIGTPDERLLKTIMVKLFADRQLDVAPHVLDYVALRMERSMDWICRFVEAADKASLSARRKLSRKIASDVIEGLSI